MLSPLRLTNSYFQYKQQQLKNPINNSGIDEVCFTGKKNSVKTCTKKKILPVLCLSLSLVASNLAMPKSTSPNEESIITDIAQEIAKNPKNTQTKKTKPASSTTKKEAKISKEDAEKQEKIRKTKESKIPSLNNPYGQATIDLAKSLLGFTQENMNEKSIPFGYKFPNMWCAAFVKYCMQTASGANPENYDTSIYPWCQNYGADTPKWYENCYEPWHCNNVYDGALEARCVYDDANLAKRGDIVLFNTSGRIGHMGFVDYVDFEKNLVHTIEGNTNVDGTSKVGKKTYDLTTGISTEEGDGVVIASFISPYNYNPDDYINRDTSYKILPNGMRFDGRQTPYDNNNPNLIIHDVPPQEYEIATDTYYEEPAYEEENSASYMSSVADRIYPGEINSGSSSNYTETSSSKETSSASLDGSV